MSEFVCYDPRYRAAFAANKGRVNGPNTTVSGHLLKQWGGLNMEKANSIGFTSATTLHGYQRLCRPICG